MKIQIQGKVSNGNNYKMNKLCGRTLDQGKWVSMKNIIKFLELHSSVYIHSQLHLLISNSAKTILFFLFSIPFREYEL